MAPSGLGEDLRAGGPAQGALHPESAPGVGCSRMRLDEEDACDVLANLTTSDFVERAGSKKTGEWMYVFKPTVGEVILYVKVILRSDCVVISFHDEEDQSDEED